MEYLSNRVKWPIISNASFDPLSVEDRLPFGQVILSARRTDDVQKVILLLNP